MFFKNYVFQEFSCHIIHNTYVPVSDMFFKKTREPKFHIEMKLGRSAILEFIVSQFKYIIVDMQIIHTRDILF